ncbi:MAG: Tar ligand binding domain-containing protein, partial [Vitreoscilla sp.]
MFSKVSLRAKLIALLAVSVLSLGINIVIAVQGMKQDAVMLAEVGANRLPSVVSLQVINEGQTAIRSAMRAIDSRASYPEEHKEIANLLKTKAGAWARVDAAWKV